MSKSRFILAAFAALALFAGTAAMASTAAPPGLSMSSTNAKEVTILTDKATLPDKRFGADAIARFKESQHSSVVVGGNVNASLGVAQTDQGKLVGITRLDKVRIVGHVTSGFSPVIGTGCGDHSTTQMDSASGHAVTAYSIAGMNGS